MQNLAIWNFFEAPELFFDAKFGTAILSRNFDPPWKGKSPPPQKIHFQILHKDKIREL